MMLAPIKDPAVYRLNDCNECGLQSCGFERDDPAHGLYLANCESCGTPWTTVTRFRAEELCRGAIFAAEDAEIDDEGGETQ